MFTKSIQSSLSGDACFEIECDNYNCAIQNTCITELRFLLPVTIYYKHELQNEVIETKHVVGSNVIECFVNRNMNVCSQTWSKFFFL